MHEDGAQQQMQSSCTVFALGKFRAYAERIAPSPSEEGKGKPVQIRKGRLRLR